MVEPSRYSEELTIEELTIEEPTIEEPTINALLPGTRRNSRHAVTIFADQLFTNAPKRSSA
jgi:hypothetical protein